MRVKLIEMDGENNGSEELRRITKVIRPFIAQTAKRIFLTFREELLTSPLEYIVPAVWGAKNEGELDDTQRTMYMQAQRMVSAAADLLHIAPLDRAQCFCIEFLLRELLISKIIIWKTTRQSMIGLESCLPLNELEMAGNA